jgi:hypothetical protein
MVSLTRASLRVREILLFGLSFSLLLRGLVPIKHLRRENAS